MSKKVTVSDIAKKAGVSPATVSRVFNHRQLVKSETVALVEGAMSALGKMPAAVSDTNENKDILLLNIQDINNVFYQEIMSGANMSAKSHNCDLIVSQSQLDKGNMPDFLRLIHNVNASGVILLQNLHQTALDSIHSEVPLVQCCEYNPTADYPYVTINNYSSAKVATEYLIASGRGKIAFINGPLTYGYALERRRGFLDAMNGAGLSVRPNWMIQLPKVNFDMAYASVCQMLDSRILPNAVFAVSDVLAAAAIKAAKHYHLKVPDDIAVVGFDNIPYSSMNNPSITTVSQPAYQLGFTACEMLLEHISSPENASSSIMLNTEFIIRESTSLTMPSNSFRSF